LAELYVWAFGKANPALTLTAIEGMFTAEVTRLDFDDDCAKQFGQLRVDLRQRGIGVHPVDLMIASVALVYNVTLVTNNTVDFQNIPGLRLDDWLTP
jgi:tRNA(fMet)-specific endonuclease VapC